MRSLNSSGGGSRTGSRSGSRGGNGGGSRGGDPDDYVGLDVVGNLENESSARIPLQEPPTYQFPVENLEDPTDVESRDRDLVVEPGMEVAVDSAGNEEMDSTAIFDDNNPIYTEEVNEEAETEDMDTVTIQTTSSSSITEDSIAKAPKRVRSILIRDMKIEDFCYEAYETAVKESIEKLSVRKVLEDKEMNWLHSNPHSVMWGDIVTRINDTLDMQDVQERELGESIQFIDYRREVQQLHSIRRDIIVESNCCKETCSFVIDEVVADLCRQIGKELLYVADQAGRELDMNIFKALNCLPSIAFDESGLTQVVFGTLERKRQSISREYNNQRASVSEKVSVLCCALDKALESHQRYGFGHFYVDEMLHNFTTKPTRFANFGIPHKHISLPTALSVFALNRNTLDTLNSGESMFIKGWHNTHNSKNEARPFRSKAESPFVNVSVTDGCPSCIELFPQQYRRQSVMLVGTTHSRLFAYSVYWTTSDRPIQPPALIGASIAVPKVERSPIIEIKVVPRI
jgi:hypothetical protein